MKQRCHCQPSDTVLDPTSASSALVFHMRWIGLMVASLLVARHAEAQTVTIGSTTFPRGELAFPESATCIGSGGCAGGVLLLDSRLQPVSREQALVGHTLDLVVIDLDAMDEFRLSFALAISNQAGADLYLAQAEFLADLADPPGQGVKEVQIRIDGAADWRSVPAARFARDALVGEPSVYYSDPEIKSDAYRLWFALVDLSDYGLAPSQEIATLDVRGPQAGPAVDLVVTGTTNPGPPSVPGSSTSLRVAVGMLMLCAATLATQRRERRARMQSVCAKGATRGVLSR